MFDADELPFANTNEIPCEINSLPNPIPFTLVNSGPLELTNFVAPYVPVTDWVCQAAIQFSTLTSNDVLGDLGCGDGRILASALDTTLVKKCIGVELDPYLVEYIQKTYAE